MRQFRQGDVLLIETQVPRAGFKHVPRENGRIVLAYGEATGHAHAILDEDVKLLQLGDERFLRVGDGGSTVRHEEHAPVAVPAGGYKVVRQSEYAPEEIRNVGD